MGKGRPVRHTIRRQPGKPFVLKELREEMATPIDIPSKWEQIDARLEDIEAR